MSIFSIGTKTVNQKQISQTVKYIDGYWAKLEHESVSDQQTLIGLPNPYLVPSTEIRNGFVYREMYYWDNYFFVEAMLASGKTKMAKGIVDNMLYLIDMFGFVPNANRYYMLSRSQPPLLTSMILSVYEATKDSEWLARAINLAEKEYHQVWMGRSQPHNRQVFRGLSRYYDINVLHQLAEAESGWDYTPRFDNRCLDFLPVDLNSYLHKYETDFASLNSEHSSKWLEKSRKRQKAMRRYMWDKEAGLLLDYDFVNRRKAQSVSLASYIPLFVGLASSDEAQAAKENLIRFETSWGLSATSLDQSMHVGKQWAVPNGWAPLHYMVIKGLERYGYYEDAGRIAEKWLELNLKVFKKNKVLYEKYNVVKGSSKSMPGVYPAQIGFGWTNAVFRLLAEDYT